MNRYNIYHKHDHISSIFTSDSNVKNIDYVNRCLELNEPNYFTTNHGSGGDIFDAKTQCDKNNINCKFGIEGYIVKNPLEKDNRNYHIILIPKTNIARKKLNVANSRANKEGYYYKPRLFLEDLLNNFESDELYITTACVAGILRDDDAINNIFKPLYEKYNNNLFLEVQDHNVDIQKNLNTKVLQMAKEYNLNIIHANDSHYIYPEQAKERLELLKGKGINYGDEDNFILDYPTYEEIVKRYKLQGILSDNQIYNALNNTLIFDDCENIQLDKEIKMPTIYPQYNDDEKITLLRNITNDKFKKMVKQDDISKEKQKDYIREVRKELQTIQDTSAVHTADYFLLNIKLFDLAVNKYGGILTKTGRGCFTKNALVYTKDNLKTIDNITNNDYVLSSDGEWNKVINTYKYDIEEPLIEFEYIKQGSSSKLFKNQCTLDHKILVNRENKIQYIEAQDLHKNDLLCSAKIQNTNNYNDIVIDLNKYNTMGYNYDNNYIYETHSLSNEYKYSPRWCQRNINVNSNFCKKIANGYIPKEDSVILKRLLEGTPFKTVENYRKYLNKRNHNSYKIKRFIKLTYLWNIFIGMMYGDGWTQKDYGIGLAINRTSKNSLNRKVFYDIVKEIGWDINGTYVNKAKNKNLDQLIINSHILNNFFKTEFFESKKGKNKIFNSNLFNQNITNLKWLYIGLLRTDGSINYKENKLCFDSTSLSLISAFKTLNNMLNSESPLSLDVRYEHKDKRGYDNKQSYKLRKSIVRKRQIIMQDNKYWYLPITKIIKLPSTKTTVYDLNIENNHSYTINNIVVHNSCGSFLLNKVLGLTQIDRLTVDLPLYTERFISKARLLENRAIPDFDANVVSQEPFVKASRELLGEHGCYPMIAYGTMKESEAFRNICRSNNLSYDEYNEVAKNIDNYRNDIKWKKYIDEAQKYVGTIISASVHPCAHLLSNDDIESEIGVLKIGDNICTMITSSEADEYKYLKNDYLIVSVWDIISQVFKEIGQPIMTIKQLRERIDDKVWKLFDDGMTCTLNQVDGDWATKLLMQYKPRTVEELAMFTGCIRPNFAPLRDDFIARKPYTTGSKDMDKLFEQTKHRVIFQENLMQYFEWLGITPSKSISLIKKISKKKIHQKDFDDLNETLKKNWIEKVGTINGFQKTWDEMQSSMSYSYNVPHALAVALDCLYCAYLKANYPLQYYAVVLNIYHDDNDKTNRLIEELKYFNIKLSDIKFRYSSEKYGYDINTNTIYKSLASIKNISNKCGEYLYSIKDNKYKNFFEFISLLPKDCINSKQLDILVKLNFFSEFGDINQLLSMIDIFNNYGSCKQIKKNTLSKEILEAIEPLCAKNTEKTLKEFDNDKIMNVIYSLTPIPPSTSLDSICYELELLGYTDITIPDSPYYAVESVDINQYGTPFINLYQISNGISFQYKCDKKFFNSYKCEQGDILDVVIRQKPKKKLVGQDENGKNIWENGELEDVIKVYDVIKRNKIQ